MNKTRGAFKCWRMLPFVVGCDDCMLISLCGRYQHIAFTNRWKQPTLQKIWHLLTFHLYHNNIGNLCHSSPFVTSEAQKSLCQQTCITNLFCYICLSRVTKIVPLILLSQWFMTFVLFHRFYPMPHRIKCWCDAELATHKNVI